MNRIASTLTGFVVLGLLSCAARGATAADDDEDSTGSQDARWSLSLATQVDQQSARGFDGSVGYGLTPTTELLVSANAVDYTATNPNGFHSQGLELGASHDFKRFTVDGSVGRWQDTDILTAKELKVGGEFHADPWAAELRTAYRRSDFDPFASDRTFTHKDGTTRTVSATSRCQIRNTELGLGGRYQGDVWGASASVMNYQYAKSTCRFTSLGLGDKATLTKAEFRQLAAFAVDRLAAVATRRIGRNQTLLDSSIDIGASWKHSDLIVSVDYSRQKEFFKGAKSNTISTTGTADLGSNAGVDVTLGLTRGNGVSSGAFVGFAVRAHF